MTNKILKSKIKSLLNKLPYLRGIAKKLEFYKNSFWAPPGHFYSPVINLEDILKRKEQIFKDPEIETYGVDLNVSQQLQLLHSFSQLPETPFSANKTDGFRYYYENKFFTYSDGFFLKSILLHFRPERIIEVGSGFSSALMLDVSDIEFSNSIKLTFIEPFPENRFNKIVRESDQFTLIKEFVQDLELEVFKELKSNDILFIDSSHVVKTGSELNFLLFEVLPVLSPGVIIHFHDIFYPFEYPMDWALEKRSWNENYFLRAFLMHNPDFKILIFNSFLSKFYKKEMGESSEILLKESGSSLWIQKV